MLAWSCNSVRFIWAPWRGPQETLTNRQGTQGDCDLSRGTPAYRLALANYMPQEKSVRVRAACVGKNVRSECCELSLARGFVTNTIVGSTVGRQE
jgi:hypothetical protein